jgi:hypothetical protein
MKKKTQLRFGLIMTILFVAVPARSVSINAAEFSADIINTSPVGKIEGKMFFKEGNFRQEMMIGGFQKMSMPMMPGMQHQ